MKPETRFQKEIMDAIQAIVAETGRAATITEVSRKTGRSVATVHKHAQNLKAIGLLREGRKLQPSDSRYEKGWRDGVTYIGNEVARVLVEHHAGDSLTKAADEAIQGAREAAL